MTLHLTPELLELSYQLCAVSAPIKNWRLPDPDEIVFRVLAAKERYGHFRAGVNGGLHEIAVSNSNVGSLDLLNRTMLHEICHLEDFRRTGDGVSHGVGFRALAREVSRHHCLDPKGF